MFDTWNTTHTHIEYDKFVSRSASFVKWMHICRAVIAILACLPNTFVILLYWKASKRRPSAVKNRVNYAIVNLLIANIVYCCILCVHSFLKRFAHNKLKHTGPCLTLTWFTVFASFEPIWAMGLVAFARLIYFARIDRLERWANSRGMVITRVVIFILNIIAASAIIAEEEHDVMDTNCNYQLMLDNSKIYLAYSLLIMLYLGATGIVSFVFRMLLRRALLTQIYAAERLPPQVSTDSTKTNDQRQLNSPDPPGVPPLIWQKPKLILIAAIVLILFFLPRVAFYSGSPPFWLMTTLCPAVMAFLLPLFFLWTTKEFRIELRILCGSFKQLECGNLKVHGV